MVVWTPFIPIFFPQEKRNKPDKSKIIMRLRLSIDPPRTKREPKSTTFTRRNQIPWKITDHPKPDLWASPLVRSDFLLQRLESVVLFKPHKIHPLLLNLYCKKKGKIWERLIQGVAPILFKPKDTQRKGLNREPLPDNIYQWRF